MSKLVMKNDINLSLRDMVFITLREAILKGVFKPGDRLMEISLAKEMGVSRTPVREALQKLEKERLVNILPRKGVFVASITKEDVKDVLEVRKHLEELVVVLSCERATKEDINEMLERKAEFESAINTGDITRMAEADVAFHNVIYKSTGNQSLIEVLKNLHEKMYRYRMEHLKDKEGRKSLINEHDRLIEAIRTKNEDAAKEIINNHIDNQKKNVIKHLDEI